MATGGGDVGLVSVHRDVQVALSICHRQAKVLVLW